MSIPHVKSGQVINLEDRVETIETGHSRALVKTDDFEAMLMLLSNGQALPEHAVTGPFTVQCLRGEARFSINDQPRQLTPGDWLFVDTGLPYAVEAKSDCSLLITVVFAEGTHA